ncbi:hypothetical protein BO224_08810 [Erysipelotrichaceae bacterium NYU-BL-E8]|nr:hypothetical protein BO224_08810 [Erysipelotrichaceae bacterium NYU-BL-E8]
MEDGHDVFDKFLFKREFFVVYNDDPAPESFTQSFEPIEAELNESVFMDYHDLRYFSVHDLIQ